jgi:hypothetical protein
LKYGGGCDHPNSHVNGEYAQLYFFCPFLLRSHSHQGCERICIFCNGTPHTLYTYLHHLTRLTLQVERCISAMAKLLKIHSKGSLSPSFGPLTLCIDVPQTSVEAMTLDSVIQSATAGLSSGVSGSRYEACRFVYAIPLLIKIQPGMPPPPPLPLPPHQPSFPHLALNSSRLLSHATHMLILSGFLILIFH